MKKLLVILGVCIAAGAALAQNPPPESVTVTGTRNAITDFINAATKPTPVTGKVARWEVPICPYTIGIKPEAAAFVTRRVREVAVQVGARVADDARCNYNIEIVFTKTPQALLDDIKKNQPDLLGYYTETSQRDALARFRGPIQGWYMTASRDLRGKVEVDSTRSTSTGPGTIMILPCTMVGASRVSGRGDFCTTILPARLRHVTGARLGDGVHGTLHHVVIVVDPRRIAGDELGAVSDYIAMLALTQVSEPERCQALPSIMNLLPPGCGAKPPGLSEGDLAYLRGLYSMNADLMAQTQKNQIATTMEQALGSR